MHKGCFFTKEEFRSQEPESSMDSVRVVNEYGFKAPDFNRGE